MKQTLEKAASNYAYDNSGNISSRTIKFAFKAGAEWKEKQSPWILIGDRSNPMPQDKPCLLLLEDGRIVDDRSDFTELKLLIIAWMPIPSFDEILEANKDVLQRLKEKGD